MPTGVLAVTVGEINLRSRHIGMIQAWASSVALGYWCIASMAWRIGSLEM
jgi:hypothetical protein